jgi:hypothetical protein
MAVDWKRYSEPGRETDCLPYERDAGMVFLGLGVPPPSDSGRFRLRHGLDKVSIIIEVGQGTGLLTGSSPTTTIWLRGEVGVGGIGIFGIPFGLFGLVCGVASGKVRDVVKGSRGSFIYFLISSLYV